MQDPKHAFYVVEKGSYTCEATAICLCEQGDHILEHDEGTKGVLQSVHFTIMGAKEPQVVKVLDEEESAKVKKAFDDMLLIDAGLRRKFEAAFPP